MLASCSRRKSSAFWDRWLMMQMGIEILACRALWYQLNAFSWLFPDAGRGIPEHVKELIHSEEKSFKSTNLGGRGLNN